MSGNSSRFRAWGIVVPLLLIAGIGGVILFAERSPVRIHHLGYTNFEGRTIALFGITNKLRHPLRGQAFAQTNVATMPIDGGQRITNWSFRATNVTIRASPNGPVLITQTLWRAITTRAQPEPPTRREIWLGAADNPPHHGMILGLRKPPGTWRLTLYFASAPGSYFDRCREKLAAFLRARGWARPARWLEPAHEPLIVSGPELSGP